MLKKAAILAVGLMLSAPVMANKHHHHRWVYVTEPVVVERPVMMERPVVMERQVVVVRPVVVRPYGYYYYNRYPRSFYYY